jgi:hypothetical protein
VGGFIQVLQFPPPIKLTNLFIIVWSYSNILKRMVIVKKITIMNETNKHLVPQTIEDRTIQL